MLINFAYLFQLNTSTVKKKLLDKNNGRPFLFSFFFLYYCRFYCGRRRWTFFVRFQLVFFTFSAFSNTLPFYLYLSLSLGTYMDRHSEWLLAVQKKEKVRNPSWLGLSPLTNFITVRTRQRRRSQSFSAQLRNHWAYKPRMEKYRTYCSYWKYCELNLTLTVCQKNLVLKNKTIFPASNLRSSYRASMLKWNMTLTWIQPTEQRMDEWMG